MKRVCPSVLFLTTVLAVSGGEGADRSRIYGKVFTRQGDVFEGPMRWDNNEGNWFDILDGSKRLPERNRLAAQRARQLEEPGRREVRFLGIKIMELDPGGGFPGSASAGIRFGHLQRLEPLGRNRGRLILKSGEEVVLESSSDLGRSVSEIIVEDASKGKVELEWDDVEVIEFMQPVIPRESEFGDRLYGMLLTRRAGGFKGLVCWDADEIFSRDILDGKAEGKTHKIEFGQIASIQQQGSRRARVTLKSGEELVLSGTNDVDDDNRGILLLDPGLGQVRVDWDEFDRLILEPIPEDLPLDFDGGRPLWGTVLTEGGDEHRGAIRWDNDEEYSWEILNGESRGVEFSIELGLVSSIEKSSRRSCVVTLRDGRSFELEGSNDVNEENKGIFISSEDGGEVMVAWDHFRRVDFR